MCFLRWGADINFKDNIRKWTLGLSDYEACVGLADPRPLEFAGALQSANVPTLCLVDALRADGYTFTMQKIKYKDGTERSIDMRNAAGRRNYFKCVLCLQDLFKHGAPQFTSTLSNAFYALLLRNPSQRNPLINPSCAYSLLRSRWDD